MNLYTECAKSLDLDGDSQGAFKIYFECLSDVNAKNASKYQTEATALLVNAVKGPQVINFEEVMVLDVVQDLKNSAKALFEFIDLFTKADVATFKKSATKMKKLMDEHKINMDQAVLKKQYVDVCTLANKNNTSEMKMPFKDLQKLLDIKQDEVDEWVIEAMENGIIDAQIDQVVDTVIIKTFKQRVVDTAEWAKIKEKIGAWKARFTKIEQVLKVQPEVK